MSSIVGIDMNNYDISMGTGVLRVGGGGGLAGNVYINGNVGIGVIPRTQLDVNGKISSNAEISVGGTPNAGISGGYRLLRLTPVSGTATQITFDTSISTGTGQNYIYSDNTIMEIKSPLINFTGGNVCIGTTSPQAKLDVNGTARMYCAGLGTSGSYLSFGGVNGNFPIIDSAGTSTGLGFNMNGTERMRITSTGLDVSGAIGFSYSTVPTFTSSQIGYTYNVNTTEVSSIGSSFTTIATISSVPIGVWLFTTNTLFSVTSGVAITLKIVAGTTDVQSSIYRAQTGGSADQSNIPIITVVNNTSVQNYTLQIRVDGSGSLTSKALTRGFRATRIA